MLLYYNGFHQIRKQTKKENKMQEFLKVTKKEVYIKPEAYLHNKIYFDVDCFTMKPFFKVINIERGSFSFANFSVFPSEEKLRIDFYRSENENYHTEIELKYKNTKFGKKIFFGSLKIDDFDRAKTRDLTKDEIKEILNIFIPIVATY